MSEQNETGTALTVRERTKALVETLEGRREAFERALARQVDPDRFIQIVATAFMGSDRLQRCSMLSIYKASIECASTGLKPDGEEAAIIPYKIDGQYQAQFQPGYIGLARLMVRAGAKKVEARVVREGDHFEYGYGLKPYLEHRPKMGGGLDRDVVAAYAIVWLPTGETQFEVMERDELDKIAAFAKKKMGGKTSPARRDWEDQMHRKAPLRRLRKFVELDANASAAFRKDALLEGGEAVPLGELDPRFEVRSIAERATEHARRQTRQLRRATEEASTARVDPPTRGGGPPQARTSEVSEAADEAGSQQDSEEPPPFDVDSEVPKGKHGGETWRAVIESDRKYAEDVVAHGWLLDEAGIEGLRRALAETATADDGEDEPEEKGDADGPDPDELLRRGRHAVKVITDRGEEVSLGEKEELELLHDDGDVEMLERVVTTLEGRAGVEPDLFGGDS